MSLTLTPDEIVAKAESSGSVGLLGCHPSWPRARISDLVHIQNGAAFKSSHFNNSGHGLPLIRIRDVGVNNPTTYYDGDYGPEYVVSAGDLLIGMDGDFRAEPWVGRTALLNQRVCRLTVTSELLDPRWLRYVIQGYLDAIWAETSSVTVKHLSSRTIAQIAIPLPPIPEQHRVAEVIEDQLSRLDAAEQSLSLASMRAEKLVSMAINYSRAVVSPTDDHAAPPTPADVVDVELPQLPASWTWKRLGEIGEVVGGITKDAKKQSDETFPLHPYLRVANVQAGHLNLEHITEIRATPKQVEKLTLRHGDVLLNEGGDRDKLGRGWIWEDQIPNCLHQNHVFRVRVDPEIIDPRLIAWHANSFGRSWFIRNGKQSVNLASVSLTTIKAFPIPVPPPDEQKRIVDDIVAALDSHARLESAVKDAALRSAALRRSVLRSAFNGELVDQDPTDEPADVALARLRDQHQNAGSRRRRVVTK